MKIVSNRTISTFISHLSSQGVTSEAAIFRINTAISFINWLSSSKRISENDAVRFRSELYKAKNTYIIHKAPLSSLPLKYVGFSLAILSVLLLGGGIYLRFYKNVRTPFAFSTAPVRAGRTINFQGRMTDTLGNPITAPIDVTYNFYTVSTGGSPIASSTRVCTASPDQDGIFNSLIGNDVGGAGATLCNVEIPSSVFTENANVYLGVTIGSEITEMSPRQQIANVGYAINSETLQGMPPGQSVSNIPFINQDGNMLIAAANPGVRSLTSSNFTISSALATTIQSASSGDITLDATAGGSLRFKVYNGSPLEAMTVLNTGRVGIGTTAPRALLDVNGDATVSGSLIAGGQIKVGDFNAAPTNVGNGSLYYDNNTNKVYFWNGSAWTEMGAGGAQYFQRTLGSLAPANIADDLNLGAVATASAIVHLPGLTNNNAFFNLGTGGVGIGNTAPGAKLDIGLAGSILGTLRLAGNTSGYLQIQPSAAAGSWTMTLPGSGGTNGYILKTDGSGVTSWADPTVLVGGVNLWQLNLGALSPANISNSLNLGATATSSALIHLAGTAGENSWFTTGNVGIGTTTPTTKLDIEGSASSSGVLSFRGTTDPKINILNGESFGIQTSVGGDTGLTERLTVSNSGNVGIGTTAPTAKLDIAGNLNVSTYATMGASLALGTSSAAAGPGNLDMSGSLTISGAIKPGGAAGTSGFLLTSSAGGVNTWTDPSSITGVNYWQRTLGSLAPINITDDLNLGAVSTASAIVHLPGMTNQNASFNLGTGTLTVGIAADTSKRLEILGGAGGADMLTLTRTVGATTSYGFSLTGGGLSFHDITNSSYPFNLFGGATNYLYLGQAAKVAGTGTPAVFSAETLSAAAGTDVAAGSFTLQGGLGTGAGASGDIFFKLGDIGTSGTTPHTSSTKLTIKATSGNVGVGTTAPTAKLDISGNLNVSTYATISASLALGTSSAAAGPGNLDMSGNLNTAGTVTFSTLPTGIVHSTSGVLSSSALNLASEVTGLLSSLNGGTGADNSTAAQYSVPYYSATGVLGGALAPGTIGYVLSTNGAGGVPSWINASGVGTNYWSIAGGAIYPTNTTLDTFIGGTASTSAKFAFLNANSSTPTASISGTIANVRTFIDGNGNISTTNRQDLVLGNSATYNSTGNILLNPNGTGNVGIGITTPTAKLDVRGDLTTGTNGTEFTVSAAGAVTSASTYNLQTISSAASFTGTVNAVTGYKVNGTATLGNVLRGNGTNFVSATLAGSDITGAALTKTDDTNVTVTLGGSPTTALLNASSLTLGWTGQLAVARGGTNGIASPTAGTVAFGNGTAYAFTSVGLSGQPLLSAAAGTPIFGTLGVVYGGSGADLSGVATGGLIWKNGASTLAGTGALTGILKGNTAGAPTALTSTSNYVTYWSDANTITGEQFLATSRGGLGASMTAAGAGEIPYSTSTTAYGHLAAGTSGYVLKSNGASAPAWVDVASLSGVSQYWQRTLGSLAPTNITDALNLGAIATGSAIVHLPGTIDNDAWFNLGTGNVGIGFTNPTAGYKLEVNGKIRGTSFWDTDDGTETYFVNPSGATSALLLGDITTSGDLSAVDGILSGGLLIGSNQAIQASSNNLYFNYFDGAVKTGMTLSNTGRVGIGNTAPDALLKLGTSGTLAGTLSLTGVTSGAVIIQTAAAAGSWTLTLPDLAGTNGYVLKTDGSGVTSWTDPSALVGGTNLWQRTTGSVAPINITDDINVGSVATSSALVHLPGITNNNAFFNLGSGGVGIGTTTVTASSKLDVVGRVLATEFYDRDASTYFLNPANGGTSLNILGTAVMGGGINMIGGGTTSIINTDNASTWTPIILKGSNDTTSVSVCIEGTATGANCNGKLDAGTVDPPYTINGKKYATYMPSMTGVKEETTGQVKLTTKSNSIAGYEYTIDFNTQPDGSDLWLFTKASALKSNINRMSVLLSPSENARTWYKIDEARHTLTLFASRPTTISYRLTAPRFDDEKWKNANPNGSHGFIIDDPDIASQNDVSLDGNGNLTGQLIASVDTASEFQVLDEMGLVVEETVLQAKTISAHIVAGLISAQKIVSPLAEIETVNVSKKISSPVVETNTIKSANTDVTVILGNGVIPESKSGELSKLIINGLNNALVASIDAAGNATFAGTLTADSVESRKSKVESLEAQNASVSGTLVAKNIQSETIDQLSSQIASSASTLSTNYQLLSTNINSVQSELASLKTQPLPNPAYYQNIDASYSNITIDDTANIYKAHITDSLAIGSLLIQSSSILALSNDLYISSLSTIHLFDDAVVIAKNGNMEIKGEIAASSLAIKNTDGVTVASIDASGSAKFNEVIAKKFTLENIATQGALIADSGIMDEMNSPIPAIKTHAEVAGTGVLPIDTKEIIIYNDNVTENSLIYLTPTSNNIQGQLSVAKKVSCVTNIPCTPYFVVSSNSSIHSASSFNWLIIN